MICQISNCSYPLIKNWPSYLNRTWFPALLTFFSPHTPTSASKRGERRESMSQEMVYRLRYAKTIVLSTYDELFLLFSSYLKFDVHAFMSGSWCRFAATWPGYLQYGRDRSGSKKYDAASYVVSFCKALLLTLHIGTRLWKRMTINICEKLVWRPWVPVLMHQQL